MATKKLWWNDAVDSMMDGCQERTLGSFPQNQQWLSHNESQFENAAEFVTYFENAAQRSMQLCEVGCIRQVIAEELEKSSCDICICAAFSTPTPNYIFNHDHIFIPAKLPFLIHYSKQSYHNHLSKCKIFFSSCSCNKPVTLSFITAPKHTNDQLICFQYLEKHPGGLSSRNVKLFMFQVMAITMFAILMINNQSSLVTVIPIPMRGPTFALTARISSTSSALRGSA